MRVYARHIRECNKAGQRIVLGFAVSKIKKLRFILRGNYHG